MSRDRWPNPGTPSALTDQRLTPELIVAVLAEFNRVSDGAIDPYWLERIFDSRGVAVAAANAARRAQARAGSWPVVECVAAFLSPHVDRAVAEQAATFIARVKSGELAEPTEKELEQMLDPGEQDHASSQATFACCLEVITMTARRLPSAARYAAYEVSHDCLQIAHALATKVSESCAREFVAAIEATGAKEAHA